MRRHLARFLRRWADRLSVEPWTFSHQCGRTVENGPVVCKVTLNGVEIRDALLREKRRNGGRLPFFEA